MSADKGDEIKRHKHHRHHHRHHRVRNTILIIVGLLVVVGGVFAAIAWKNLASTTNDMYQSSGADKQRNASKVLSDKKPVSILLLGTDTGDLGRDDKGRTDTIIVMTINPKTKKRQL